MDEKTPAFEELKKEAPAALEWQQYYHAVVDRLWIVILLVVLGLIASLVYLKNQEKTYVARSVLFLEMDTERVLKGVETVRDVQIRSLDMVNTVVDSLKGYPFALRVSERLGLANSNSFRTAVKAGNKEMSSADAAGRLLRMVAVQYRKATRLIDIYVTTRDANLSTEIANGYANEYLRLMLERSTESTRSAGQFLVEETQRLGEKLKISEEALQSFRERERTASFENMLAEAQESSKKISLEISRNQQLLEQVQRDVEAAAKDPKNEAMLLQLPTVLSDTQIANANASIEQQEGELDLLSQRYHAEHPLYATAKKRIDVAKQDRRDLLAKTVSLLGSQQLLLEETLRRLQQQKSDAERRLLDVTAKSLEYNSLSRAVEADRALYGSVVARLKEVDVTKGMADQSIRIHEPALGASPTEIPYVKSIILGLAAGLAAGIGVALLLDAIDPTFRTVEQEERVTGVKVITAVPEIKTQKAGLIVVQERHGFVAESFRTLRTSIAMLGGREQRKVFLFTSAVPSEGKTFSSANFAATLAQQGFRTLYVDADLRKPSVSKLLFGENRSTGLNEVLLGKCTFEEALQSGGIDNLTVVTAGGRAEHPSELLAGLSFEKFIEKARQEYDRIVLDTAPVIAVSDTLLILRLADVNCLIVRAHSTPKKSVVHAIRLLDENNCPPAGVILNRMRAGRSGGYYYYSGRSYGGKTYGAKGVYGKKA